MEEVWKDIPGYEGLYQVSNLGIVKSYDRIVKHNKGGTAKRNGTVLKQSTNIWGYNMVTLCKDKIQTGKSVHRLIAISFIHNPENKPQVNHKNGVKTDNRIENLEWVDAFENMAHAFKTGLIITKKGNKSHMYGKTGFESNVSIPVVQYSLDGQFICIYGSANQAAISINGSNNSIRLCCLNKIKSSGGFQWKHFHGNNDNIIPLIENKVNRKIRQLNKAGLTINKYDSIAEAARHIKTHASAISKALKLKTTHRKHYWEYV